MIKHFITSVLLFFLLTYFWTSILVPFEVSSDAFEKQLSNALNSHAFLFELLLFFIGISLSIIYISLMAKVITESLMFLLKGNFSNPFCFFIAWVLILLVLMSLSSTLYPNLFLSHNLWSSPILVYPSTIAASLLILISYLIKKNRIYTSLLILPFLAFYLDKSENTDSYSANLNNRNIFIIGVDSLNIDTVSSSKTPNIYNFIDSGVHFPNTYTHIARTYPAWLSILTGQYPVTNKARFNLTNINNINKNNLITVNLKKHGYSNYFILDERRFSHINKKYGFNEVIGPPATVGELILSKLVEIPTITLLSQLPIFKFFMPQLHHNRAVWLTYSPKSFIYKIKSSLKFDDKPVFIASHFTLPHWPYKIFNSKGASTNIYDRYLEAVFEADKQVGDYLRFLKENNLLNNALVFIISDHGESFARKSDTTLNSKKTDNTAGHGTSIISSTQYKVLLSYQEFKEGKPINTPAIKSNFNYTLSDIAPTIVDWLKIPIEIKFDGESLLKPSHNRYLPLESSLKPVFNKTGNVDISRTLKKNSGLYFINKSGQLVLKNGYYDSLLANKQRGVIHKKWQLSIFPENNHEIYITNLEKNYLFNFHDFDDINLKNTLLEKLCTLYKKEIYSADIKPCIEIYGDLFRLKEKTANDS